MRVESDLPLETCDTLHHNGAWGYTADRTANTREEAIQLLVRTAGFDANLLLNVGPPPDGAIQEEMALVLREVGAWLSRFGHTIYADTEEMALVLREVGAWLSRFGHTIYASRGGPAPPMEIEQLFPNLRFDPLGLFQ
ncbi:alpha-L-fucosidase-domain-containing protein [Baffinella frigidus]|nr:alpha-L-fucosidase-domain-containing protein [Cryptophyta sp. CCMP2293]